jgi:hypothetical protein
VAIIGRFLRNIGPRRRSCAQVGGKVNGGVGDPGPTACIEVGPSTAARPAALQTSGFAGRQGLDGQGVDAARPSGPKASYTRRCRATRLSPAEAAGHDAHREVAAFARTGMAGVLVAVVLNAIDSGCSWRCRSASIAAATEPGPTLISIPRAALRRRRLFEVARQEQPLRQREQQHQPDAAEQLEVDPGVWC